MLEGEGVQDGLPAGTQLAERLEAAVEVGVVESALAREHLAVLDGDEAALQHGLRLNLAGDEPVHLVVVYDAHQEYRALLHLVAEHGGRVLAHLLAELLQGFFAHLALELPEPEPERLQRALVVVEHGVDGAVEVVALARVHRLVRELRLREHETAELHLQVADVVLERALCRVLALRVERRHDFELRLAPVADALLLEQLLVELARELLVDAFERGRDAEAEVAVLEVQRFRERVVHLFLVDVALFHHAAEHVAQAFLAALDGPFAPLLRALDERVVVERALHGTRDERAFRKREVLEFLVEEVLRGDRHALARARYVELVQVELEDVFLAEVPLEPERVDEFLPLGLDAPLLAAEHVLGRLLGERGAALAHVPALHVRGHRAEEPLQAEPVVRPVARVLGGHERVHDILRDVAVGHVETVVRVEEGAEQVVSVAVVHAGLARKHLEDGLAVELLVGVAVGEHLEHEYVCGDATDETDEGERRRNLQGLHELGALLLLFLLFFVCHKNRQKDPAGCAEPLF